MSKCLEYAQIMKATTGSGKGRVPLIFGLIRSLAKSYMNSHSLLPSNNPDELIYNPISLTCHPLPISSDNKRKEWIMTHKQHTSTPIFGQIKKKFANGSIYMHHWAINDSAPSMFNFFTLNRCTGCHLNDNRLKSNICTFITDLSCARQLNDVHRVNGNHDQRLIKDNIAWPITLQPKSSAELPLDIVLCDGLEVALIKRFTTDEILRAELIQKFIEITNLFPGDHDNIVIYTDGSLQFNSDT
jgi:hypothetical protein